jgi:hypothetical protein
MSWVACGVMAHVANILAPVKGKTAALAVPVPAVNPETPPSVGMSAPAFPNPVPDFWKQNEAEAYRPKN